MSVSTCSAPVNRRQNHVWPRQTKRPFLSTAVRNTSWVASMLLHRNLLQFALLCRQTFFSRNGLMRMRIGLDLNCEEWRTIYIWGSSESGCSSRPLRWWRSRLGSPVRSTRAQSRSARSERRRTRKLQNSEQLTIFGVNAEKKAWKCELFFGPKERGGMSRIWWILTLLKGPVHTGCRSRFACKFAFMLREHSNYKEQVPLAAWCLFQFMLCPTWTGP